MRDEIKNCLIVIDCQYFHYVSTVIAPHLFLYRPELGLQFVGSAVIPLRNLGVFAFSLPHFCNAHRTLSRASARLAQPLRAAQFGPAIRRQATTEAH
ncbi:hypothetical protein E0K89_000265 [Aquicoccus sp. SCR17]|nr:hypothetical protein [Carideicomes alvinocaridis]